MLAHPILLWLNNPEFNSGLELFRKYSKNTAILFFFENKLYGLDRLVTEIKKIKITAATTALPTKKNTADKIPDVIQGIIDAKNIAWKEARDLHARLMAEPSKVIRHQMAKRITELMPIVKDCWKKLDQYELTGDYSFLTEIKQESKPDLIKLFSDKILKQNYIIKARRELAAITDALKKQNKAKHLASLEADMENLNKRIDFLNKYIIDNNL